MSKALIICVAGMSSSLMAQKTTEFFKNQGKDITVGYNSKYITDCLKNITDEYIVIKINYSSPSIITGVEESDYLYLILPVRYR